MSLALLLIFFSEPTLCRTKSRSNPIFCNSPSMQTAYISIDKKEVEGRNEGGMARTVEFVYFLKPLQLLFFLYPSPFALGGELIPFALFTTYPVRLDQQAGLRLCKPLCGPAGI